MAQDLEHHVVMLSDAEGLLRRFDVPNAAIVVGAGGDLVERSTPPGPNEVYEVASLSKTATAIAVMRLVEQRDIALDDPVSDHVRNWQLTANEFDPRLVTIRRLLSHTAGLPEGVLDADLAEPFAVEEPDPSAVQVVDGERGLTPAEVVTEPDTSFLYSNPGYGVLELVIEEVTGESYADAMRFLVFEPLDMLDTGFQNDSGLRARVVPGHRSAGHPTRTYKWLPRAAGGMLSTGSDIARLVDALVTPSSEGGLLSETSLAEMREVPEAAAGAFGLGSDGGYALGLAVGVLPSGRRFVANNGSHEGYNALFVAVPDTRSYLVVLTNAETGIGLELELALRWFDNGVGERPAIATTFVNIRRAVDLGTRAALLITAVLLARQVLDLTRGRRRRAECLLLRRLFLRTAPCLVGAGVLFVCLNTGQLTGSIGGLPPSRLVSSSHQANVLWLSLALMATGTLATAAPRIAGRPA